MSSVKRTRSTSRVCTCTLKKCSEGRDPYGRGKTDERGVLLSYSAFEAHQKADLRKKVLERCAHSAPAPITPDVDRDRLLSLICQPGPDDLYHRSKRGRHQGCVSQNPTPTASQPTASTSQVSSAPEGNLSNGNESQRDSSRPAVKIDTREFPHLFSICSFDDLTAKGLLYLLTQMITLVDILGILNPSLHMPLLWQQCFQFSSMLRCIHQHGL